MLIRLNNKAKVLIRMRGCAGWSHLCCSHMAKQFLSWRGSLRRAKIYAYTETPLLHQCYLDIQLHILLRSFNRRYQKTVLMLLISTRFTVPSCWRGSTSRPCGTNTWVLPVISGPLAGNRTLPQRSTLGLFNSHIISVFSGKLFLRLL